MLGLLLHDVRVWYFLWIISDCVHDMDNFELLFNVYEN